MLMPSAVYFVSFELNLLLNLKKLNWERIKLRRREIKSTISVKELKLFSILTIVKI